MVRFHFRESPGEVNSMETKQDGGGQGLGEGMGSQCLVRPEFQLKMKKSRRWMVGMVVGQCECT